MGRYGGRLRLRNNVARVSVMLGDISDRLRLGLFGYSLFLFLLLGLFYFRLRWGRRRGMGKGETVGEKP